MFGKILRQSVHRLAAGNENAPQTHSGSIAIAKVRALATGVELATSLDTSPAVVVSIYDYARHHGAKKHRRAS